MRRIEPTKPMTLMLVGTAAGLIAITAAAAPPVPTAKPLASAATKVARTVDRGAAAAGSPLMKTAPAKVKATGKAATKIDVSTAPVVVTATRDRRRDAGGLVSEKSSALLSGLTLGAPSAKRAAPVVGPMAREGRANANPGLRYAAWEAGADPLDHHRPNHAQPDVTAAVLVKARQSRLRALTIENPATVDLDDLGNPIVRGRLLLLDADSGALAALRKAGFRAVANEAAGDLGMTITSLSVPANLRMSAAITQARSAVPGRTISFDHLFEPAGGALLASSEAAAASTRCASRSTLIGMIDGGVGYHPAIAGKIAEQRGFAGGARASGHGTAVASLLAGQYRGFRGAAPNATLLVADVYGGRKSAGSTSALIRALNWMAQERPKVVNISLVGPHNPLLGRAIAAVQAKGIPVVAAVGNDGPAAPPQYPASYPKVIAVTGVDSSGRVLLEAGRPGRIDFAAPGADLAAAASGSAFRRVRGTSFAAPLAAGRLVAVGSMSALIREAKPLRGSVRYGIVCAQCRTDPKKLGR